VRRVIDPLLSGAANPKFPNLDDIEYAENFGVIQRTSGGSYKIANQIYNEVIPRMLTHDTFLLFGLHKVNPSGYLDTNGRIKMSSLIEDFRKIYRENIESWRDHTTYKKSAKQLLLFFYLQRIVKDEGRISGEYALGNDAIDLLIEKPLNGSWVQPEQREVIEIKTVRNSDKVKKDLSTVIQEAVEQTRRYLDKIGVEEGHVILFDQRTKEDNQLTELQVFPALEEKQDNKTIKRKKVTAWCM
jgi:hypothetical protein